LVTLSKAVVFFHQQLSNISLFFEFNDKVLQKIGRELTFDIISVAFSLLLYYFIDLLFNRELVVETELILCQQLVECFLKMFFEV